ncbi:MAG: hypothetical protein WBA57_03500 [Elainellaceae cyanobacterium]
MNSTLAKKITNADGRYLADTELHAFHDFASGYSVRRSAYEYLQQHADEIVLTTLRQLMPSHRQAIQQHGDLCKRDMSYVLRYAAISMLKDDQAGFVEELVLWMQNILFALKKEQQSLKFYQELQSVLRQQMPVQEAALINQYLDSFTEALSVRVGIS